MIESRFRESDLRGYMREKLKMLLWDNNNLQGAPTITIMRQDIKYRVYVNKFKHYY